MKLTEKQMDLIVQDLILDITHFQLFEKRTDLNLKGLSFSDKRKIFTSLYHTCKVI